MTDLESKTLGQELTLLLEDAADERPGAAAAFFEMLLKCKVHVPLKPVGGESDEPAALKEGKGAERFASVDYEGKNCIPIFSEEAFVQGWADNDLIHSIEKDFKSLLWLLDDDTWLYLNPNQEIGKEITAWEIGLLRKGADAIPELVAALSEDPFTEIEVRSDPNVYPGFREKLLPILEIYPELEECFLAAVKEGGSQQEKPIVGLRWQGGNKAKRMYIKSEIEQAAEDSLPECNGAIVVMDDLDNPDSPNHSIFSDCTPIYFQKPYREPTFFDKLTDKVRGLLGKTSSNKGKQ